MTREEIMAIVPGNELDALVAEKVMGYKITTGSTGEKYLDGFSISKIPSYSEKISAVWEVVEKFKGKIQIISHKDCYECVIWNGSKVDYLAEGFTAPEAIAKAALLSVMGVGE